MSLLTVMSDFFKLLTEAFDITHIRLFCFAGRYEFEMVEMSPVNFSRSSGVKIEKTSYFCSPVGTLERTVFVFLILETLRVFSGLTAKWTAQSTLHSLTIFVTINFES